jgi:hypothetical protein
LSRLQAWLQSPEGMFAPGWQHKWLALAVVLGWVFLNKFRLLGLALAKLMTLKLAYDRDTAALEIAVRVERMTLQPLQLVGVELSSGGQWSVAFSKITLRSFVREFFRSFGQVRILALEIESVKVSVSPMDDEFVNKMIKIHQDNARRKTAAAAAAAAHSSQTGTVICRISRDEAVKFVAYKHVRVFQPLMAPRLARWYSFASSTFTLRTSWFRLTGTRSPHHSSAATSTSVSLMCSHRCSSSN